MSAVAEVLSWVSNAEPTFVTPVAFMATVFFVGRLAWTQYWEAQLFRDATKPKFEIVFEPTGDEESRPYLQIIKFEDHAEFQPFPESSSPVLRRKRTIVTKMAERRYRVGVRSLSTAIVPSVELVLVACEPGGNHVHVGHRLAVMDSNTPAAARDLAPHPQGKP
ncbi:MAG: hypothetical protein ACRD2N_25690, partial [Vicinamibacterales bacterium]